MIDAKPYMDICEWQHAEIEKLRFHIAELKRQHVEELAKMAGDQLARDADMYNLAEENRRLKAALGSSSATAPSTYDQFKSQYDI